MGNKAKEFIRAGDRFVVYAIYQYDDKPGALMSYLTYKQNETDRIRKEVKQRRSNIKRRKSCDAFMAERREVLANARKLHASGIKRVQKEKKEAIAAAAAAEEEEAAEAVEDEGEEDENGRKRGNKRQQTNKPRWLLLYEAKFSSYNELLYDAAVDQGGKGSKDGKDAGEVSVRPLHCTSRYCLHGIALWTKSQIRK